MCCVIRKLERMLAECEAALRAEYTRKVELLNSVSHTSGIQYRLVDLTENGPLKVQVRKDGNLQRVLGLKSVDRKISSISRTSENVSEPNPAGHSEQQLNKHLFETIQLIEKLRSQINMLK